MTTVEHVLRFVNPTPFFVFDLLDKYTENRRSILREESDSIGKILRAARDNGVERIDFKLSSNSGLQFGATLEGVPIQFDLGGRRECQVTATFFRDQSGNLKVIDIRPSEPKVV